MPTRNLRLSERLKNNKQSYKSIFVAVVDGDKNAIDALLEDESCNINMRDAFGRHVLFYAIFCDPSSPEFLEYLMGLKDIDRHAVDDNGQSALHFAAIYYRSHRVASLLKAGLDINLQDHEGFTPIHRAILRNNKKFLYEVFSYLNKEKCQYSIKINLNLQDYFTESTALHLAIENGYLDMVKLLISHGASLNVYDYKGNSPLHYAAITSGVHYYRIVSHLLDLGLNFEEPTFMWVLSTLDNSRSLRVDVVNEDGMNALDLAQKEGRDDVVKLIKQYNKKKKKIDSEDNYIIEPLTFKRKPSLDMSLEPSKKKRGNQNKKSKQ